LIHGVGTDIIEIKRIEEAFEKFGHAFFERLFTENECAYCNKYADPIPHFAGRFAAKEAIVKALGTGFSGDVQWQEIEILNNETGKPYVTLMEGLAKHFPQLTLHLSISHCKSYATALCVIEKTKN
jgi:holo-[acyl-carrier protein] synthase